jgi:hypothetical protein
MAFNGKAKLKTSEIPPKKAIMPVDILFFSLKWTAAKNAISSISAIKS